MVARSADVSRHADHLRHAYISFNRGQYIRGNAVAEARADGAVNEAIFQVLTRHWKADGAPHVVPGAQVVTEVRVDDEAGKIDPNVAPAVLMQALLRECGAPPKTAAQLADTIAEWRSVDLLQANGSLRGAQYRLAGRSYLPPNSRFVSVDELGLVLGMTSTLLGCLEPHISVYSLSVPALETTNRSDGAAGADGSLSLRHTTNGGRNGLRARSHQGYRDGETNRR
jgi:general secretion pathway protein K